MDPGLEPRRDPWQLFERAGGLVLLAVAAVLAYLGRPEGDSAAYRAGAAFGSIAVSFALAAAGRALAIRFGSARAPVAAPALLLIAGAIAFCGALVSLGED